MPTETFFRLPEEKRQRIAGAATEEFARAPYSLCSINRVVKAAGISRGSFYQYFADKEDLYRYILSLIHMEKLAIYERDAPPPGEGSVFAPLMAALPSIFRWVEENPHYYRIGHFLAAEEPDFIRHVLTEHSEGLRWYRGYLEAAMASGHIRPDANLELLGTLLTLYSTVLLETFYQNPDRTRCERALEEFFDLMERGVRREGGPHG